MDHKFTILFPLDGDMLNERDGVVLKDGSLEITVKVDSDKGITVNGTRASLIDGLYQANIQLKDYANTITVSQSGGESQKIKVYRLKNYTGKYRLSLDDNIWFLEDIAKNQDKYSSIFETPTYIHDAGHRPYGTKNTNIYYRNGRNFKLSMMPDKYKESHKTLPPFEFSCQGTTDKPYIHASYEEVKRIVSGVNEIRRFAGGSRRQDR